MSETVGADTSGGKQEAKYRVFISYSHDDRAIAEVVEKHLGSLPGVIPMWDPLVLPGASFSDEITEMISFAHVFLPLVTPQSLMRPWVHQEIGYAMALGTPVLPLSFGALPAGMTDQLQALTIPGATIDRPNRARSAALDQLRQAQDLTLTELEQMRTLSIPETVVEDPERLQEALAKYLTEAELEDTVSLHQGTQTPLPMLCAAQPEDRALMLIDHLVAILRHNKGATPRGVRIRQEAPFGTLSLLDAPVRDKLWRCREGVNVRSEWLLTRIRRERAWTVRHVRQAGGDFIFHPYKKSSPDGAADHAADDKTTLRGEAHRCGDRVRLDQLIEFVEEMDRLIAENPELGEDFFRVVVSEEPNQGNVLMAGDWFIAETVTPSEGRGFQQTIFTRHAPTVSDRVEQFDADFRIMLTKLGVKDSGSRQVALEALRNARKRLGPKPCEPNGTGICPVDKLKDLLDHPRALKLAHDGAMKRTGA